MIVAAEPAPYWNHRRRTRNFSTQDAESARNPSCLTAKASAAYQSGSDSPCKTTRPTSTIYVMANLTSLGNKGWHARRPPTSQSVNLHDHVPGALHPLASSSPCGISRGREGAHTTSFRMRLCRTVLRSQVVLLSHLSCGQSTSISDAHAQRHLGLMRGDGKSTTPVLIDAKSRAPSKAR